MNRQDFDRLAENKQYEYHRRHFGAVRDIEQALRQAERNLIRDMSKYMPPNVVDPAAWMKLNAGPEALANLRATAMRLPEPERTLWLERLDKPSWRAQINNKSALYRRIELEDKIAKKSIDDTLQNTMGSVASEGYTRQMFEIQSGVGVAWAFDLPNKRQADAMARRVLNTKHTTNLTKRHANVLKEQLVGGILSGKSEKNIAKQIRETAGGEIWEAKRLVRTELTAAASEGEIEALGEAEIERYIFYATLDERTCPVCGKLDMQDFATKDAKDGINKPPIHPNCRCVVTAYFAGEDKEKIVRRGRNKDGKNEVMPEGMNYERWKKEYGVEKPVKAPKVVEQPKTIPQPPANESKKDKLSRFAGMDKNDAVKELIAYPPNSTLKAPPKEWKPESIENLRKAQKWTGDIPGDEATTMNMYSMDRYQQTNITLDTKKAYDAQSVSDIVKMDAVFAKSELTKPAVTHAAVGMWKLPPTEELYVGSTFPLRSYQSTSVNEKVAKRFMEDNRIMVEFRVPAGSGHAVQMDRFVRSVEEQELLLNRGKTYRIVEYTPKSSPKDMSKLVLEMI